MTPEVGYRIWGLQTGRYLVAGDGSLIHAAPPRSGWEWQRLFFSHVIPLAAVLRGLQPFHASGISVNGHAVAFTASPGTGKTTLATHLVAGGAGFITDDVLVLERGATEVLAHPGAGIMSIASEEYETLPEDARALLGTIVGGVDKICVAPDPVHQPVPLAAFFLLERGPQHAQLTLERITAPDPRSLLSATFIPHIDSPQRLREHLDVCAQLAAGAQIWHAGIPAAANAAAVASVIKRCIDQIPGAAR